MKVSIITATYNNAGTIKDTLLSVAQQQYHPVEHIIIDGLSKDVTLEIVQDFPHVAKTISEKDKGIYDAMNKGIIHASGDVIGILNSDDIYVDGQVLQKVMNCFADDSVDSCAIGLFLRLDCAGRPIANLGELVECYHAYLLREQCDSGAQGKRGLRFDALPACLRSHYLGALGFDLEGRELEAR